MTVCDCAHDGLSSGINVTPMIDVLLVLLIIFMLIAPVTPKGLSAVLPHPANGAGSTSDAVVLEVVDRNGQPSYRINHADVTRQQAGSRLSEIYANRAERVLFVKADASLSFATVADAIDLGRAAGAGRVGLLTGPAPVAE